MKDEKQPPVGIWRIRGKVLLDRWFVPIVVVLLTVGFLAGGTAVQAYANPPVESDHETVTTWEESSTISHQAIVRTQNPVFEENTTLADRGTYFLQISPELDAVYAYSYRADDAESVDVELDARLRIRSIDADDRVYWESTTPLNERQIENLEPDETAEISATINVTHADEEVERIRSDINSNVGTAEIALVFGTSVTGTIDSDSVNETHESLLVVAPGSSTYDVEAIETVDEVHETTVLTEREGSHSVLGLYGPLSLSIVTFGGVICLGMLKRRGVLSPSQSELTELERHKQRSEFDDWISVARVPEAAFAGAHIELDSLEGLVDVAIDTNQRVIEDVESQLYLVPGDGVYFTFDFEKMHRRSNTSSSSTQMDLTAATNGTSDGETVDDSSTGGVNENCERDGDIREEELDSPTPVESP